MAKIAFTAGRVSGFKCPPEKKQAFLWDATAPGLGLRATPAGKPAYVFQSVYKGKDLRITIGSPAAWSIPDAQAKARELQRLIDEGKDPRDLKREALAAHAEKQAAAAAQALTVGEVWPLYLENGKPKRRDSWKPRYRADLEAMAAPGGEKKKRGQGTTRPGPLYPLLALPLAGVNEDTLKLVRPRSPDRQTPSCPRPDDVPGFPALVCCPPRVSRADRQRGRQGRRHRGELAQQHPPN